LWRYRGAFFSRFGNLPETFVELVANAKAGLTAAVNFETGHFQEIKDVNILSIP
jgi:hypothetical protein